MESSSTKKGRAFWGENHWDVLHSSAAFYTPDLEPYYRMLIQAYKGLIPCSQCKTHFAENLVKFPIDSYLTNARRLLYWTYIVHDAVNVAHNTHRPQEPKKITPSFAFVVDKYTADPEHWDRAWCFVLHCDAVLYSPENAKDYVDLVTACGALLPSKRSKVKFAQALEKCPLEPYLRNNLDLIFWAYVICNEFTKEKVRPFVETKRYYFSGLGEECKSCES